MESSTGGKGKKRPQSPLARWGKRGGGEKWRERKKAEKGGGWKKDVGLLFREAEGGKRGEEVLSYVGKESKGGSQKKKKKGERTDAQAFYSHVWREEGEGEKRV